MPPPTKLTLFRGWDEKGRHVWSPFVVKLEARFRFAGLKYTVDIGSPKTSPKGKIPYVDIEYHEGGKEQLSDSSLILESLVRSEVLPDINARLSASERAQDLALRAMLEDKLYFYHTWERWIQNYYTMRDYALWSLALPVRAMVGYMIYRNTTTMLHGQGTSRFTPEEIAHFRLKIWQSINDLLIESKARMATRQAGEESAACFWVLGGEQPTEADCTLFGFVVSVLMSTAGPDSQTVVKSFPTIVEYAETIQATYFPDYKKLI